MLQVSPRSYLFVCVLILSFSCTSILTAQTFLGSVDFDLLQAEFGAALETGAGVDVAQVETTIGGGYVPVASGKTLNVLFSPSGQPNVTSGHATGVGANFFGSGSTSPGVDDIDVIHANDFLTSIAGFGTPVSQSYQVSNHSYIFSTSTNFSLADAELLLKRLDYSVSQGDSTVVAGTNNNARANSLPVGLAHAYNVVIVGRSDGLHWYGPTSFYGADGGPTSGRSRIDIVADAGSTSAATPRVSSAAALLHESGAGTDAVRSETMKAILLAGATKDEFATWDKTSTRPLDERYGAGELNVYNSYKIQADGEQEGTLAPGGAPVDSLGWDYEASFDPGNDMYYQFLVPTGQVGTELSAVLNWHIDIDDAPGFGFSPVANLANFDLELTRDTDGALIDISQSSVDNVEHIYATDLTSGTYTLKVSGDSNQAYGLAWRLNTALEPVVVPEPGGLVILGGIAIGLVSNRRRRG
jgi:hypothetical protein